MTNNSTESNKNPDSAFNKDMTTPTDTPRTDASRVNKVGMTFVWVEFAQQLERELAEARAEAERLRSTMQSFILVSPIEAQRMEKIEAEAEKLRLTMRSFIDFMDENLGTTADWPMEAAFDDEETCQRHCDHLNAMKRIVKPEDIN